MTQQEMAKLQTYMQKTFGNDGIGLRRGMHKDGTVEVYIDDEFIGLMAKDVEDGETSFQFQMAILEEDI